MPSTGWMAGITVFKTHWVPFCTGGSLAGILAAFGCYTSVHTSWHTGCFTGKHMAGTGTGTHWLVHTSTGSYCWHTLVLAHTSTGWHTGTHKSQKTQFPTCSWETAQNHFSQMSGLSRMIAFKSFKVLQIICPLSQSPLLGANVTYGSFDSDGA